MKIFVEAIESHQHLNLSSRNFEEELYKAVSNPDTLSITVDYIDDWKGKTQHITTTYSQHHRGVWQSSENSELMGPDKVVAMVTGLRIMYHVNKVDIET